MGQEVECSIRYKERALKGRAYLESDHVLFRGDERLKVLFRDLTTVKAQGGVLYLEFEGGPAEFELGAKAETWADKILNPPSRMHKLGVKAGMSVKLVGSFEPEFLAELKTIPLQEAGGSADLIFLAVEGRGKFYLIPQLLEELKLEGALWIIYPKSVKSVTEIDVLTAGRKAGLVDVKVASFSISHTGLKFMFSKVKRRALK
jgi:hypothetical protein